MTIEPEEYAEAAANLLRIARKQVQRSAKGDIRLGYIVGLLEIIEVLSRDVLLLEDRGRQKSASILVRSLCDCMYYLVAAAKHPDFAVAKLIYEEESEADRLEKRANCESGDQRVDCLDKAKGLRKKASEHRKLYPPKKNKKWGRLESRQCAEAADLLRHYFDEYSHFSRFTHTDLGSLILGSLDTGRTACLRNVILILNTAINCLPEVFSIELLENLKSDRAQLRAHLPAVQAQIRKMGGEEHARALAKLGKVKGNS